MKNIILFTSVFSLFAVACNNNPKQQPSEQTSAQAEHDHSHETEKIELDNGKKWTVDKEMLVLIRKMESDIEAFSKSEQKDYASLSENLKANIDLLTSNCTMEGKAHDELHKWLLPYIDMVNELEKTDDKKQAAQQFKTIQQSFITFNQYFQ